MSISSADLKFFASRYPLDVAYGGGLMGSTVVQDGFANNVFPDLAESDRAAGRVQFRKVYAAVVSTDSDQLTGTTVSIKERPADAAVDNVLIAYGDHRTTRAQLEAALGGGASEYRLGVQVYAPNPPPLRRPAYNTVTMPNGSAQPVGTLYAFVTPGSGIGPTGISTAGVTSGIVATVLESLANIALSGVDNGLTNVQFDGTVPIDAELWTVVETTALDEGASCYGASVVPGPLTSGATTATLDRTMGRLMPSTTLPPGGVVNGFANPSRFYVAGRAGRVPIFRSGDAVLIEDGSNSEAIGVSEVNHTSAVLTFSTALVNSYSAGATVRGLCIVGDMQSAVGVPFTQQTWTKTFADGPIGAPISAAYNMSTGAISANNLGAMTERWAIVFTSATEFKVIGESIGQVGSGDISTNFSPVNPNTGGVYFTIDAAGWGSGWALGNVMRFNTQAARAPFWISRTVSPSVPGGPDQCVIEMRGNV